MTQLQNDCFQAAVRTGSFAGAAKELFLSVQAVSQHILNLEQELGVKLFLRSSEGVRLTREGEEFLALSTRLAGLYTGTLHAIREEVRTRSLRLALGISDYIDVLGPISGGLTSFAALHGDVEIAGVQYANAELMEALSGGEIDAAVLSDSQITAGGDFDVFPFARENLRLYVSHVPELTEDASLKEVTEIGRALPHLDTSYGPWSSEEWEEIARRMSARLGVSYTRHYVLPNFRSVIDCVKHTRCTAVCDARFGYLRDDDPALRSFPLNADACLCVVSDRKNENPLIRAFQEHLKDYFADAL